MDTNINKTTITDEMGWILKVLLSSTNKGHIESCDRLFLNFLKKWELYSPEKNEKFINSYKGIKFVVTKKLKRVKV
jgi:hypothetical protein